MTHLHKDIGSAKDNSKSSIHNWYKFSAGFSFKFVDEVISIENRRFSNLSVFDPFAGCGTTLVSCQKKQIKAVGNESQRFMWNIIRAKTNWKINDKDFNKYIKKIIVSVQENYSSYNTKNNTHVLLRSLYSSDDLKILYLLKDTINNLQSWKYRLFFQLALSQTLHDVSIYPIAVPYILRTRKLKKNVLPLDSFINRSNQMLNDLKLYKNFKKTTKIYIQDSRKINKKINDNSCNVCITSPPYLNNLDYGEVSKVHTHFYNYTDNWNDITNQIRKNLVTGSTTHYSDGWFDLNKYLESEFYNENTEIADELIIYSGMIRKSAKKRNGKKSFDILLLLYFKDMHKVLKEIKRVLEPRSRSYLILGDSAPYGVYIPTTEIIGRIAINSGFKNYKIQNIRTRGTKWKSLKHRHNIKLPENILVLEL